MSQIPKSRTSNLNTWIKRGAMGGLVTVVLAVLLLRLGSSWFAYSMFGGELITSIPNVPDGGLAYVQGGGFPDGICYYYAASKSDPEHVYLMNLFTGDETLNDVLHFSQDGKIVVTATTHNDDPMLNENGTREPPQERYTHAFNFETRQYIVAPYKWNEDPAIRLAHHNTLSAMLDLHGGVGTTYSYMLNNPTLREMGYWEWKSWQRRVQ